LNLVWDKSPYPAYLVAALILKPERTNTNIRYYCDSDLRRLLNISILNKNGHNISNIAGLDDKALVHEAERHLSDYLKESNKIESLYLSLLEIDEAKFESIINNSILTLALRQQSKKLFFHS